MKKNLTLTAFLLCLALIFLWRFRSPDNLRTVDDAALGTEVTPDSPTPSTANQPLTRRQSSPNSATLATVGIPSNNSVAAVTNRERLLMSMYETPIDFYGRVVDEKSNGISAVHVRLMVSDKPPDGDTVYERFSDDHGFFSLTGIRGASIAVTPTKEGYYQLQTGSMGFRYAPALRDATTGLPTPDAPAIMVLRRKGVAETLVHFARRSFLVSKDGTPLEVNVAGSGAMPSVVRVAAWTSDDKKNAKNRYDWKCVISIPGGGLVERNGRFEFEAPAHGYQQSFEFLVLADAPNWRSSFQKEFFVRFNDQRFARITFNLSTKGSHSITIESFLNPTAGSRNLEYDPVKAIEVPRPTD